jgi:hypothetical protein
MVSFKLSAKRAFLFCSAMICFFVTTRTNVVASELTRVTNPSVVGVEILGKGLVYSIFFDRAMSESTAAGFAFGTAGTQEGHTAFLIPAYFTYYLEKEEGSVFLTGGLTMVLNSTSVGQNNAKLGNFIFPTSLVLPTVGVGFEDRGDAGFLFRATAYSMYAENLSFWAGFSFGYAF